MKSSAIAVVLGFACLLSQTYGDDEAAGVLVMVRAVSLPMSTATRLLPRFSRPAESEAAFAELDRLIELKEAELLEIAMAWADTGRGGESSTKLSVRYPDYDLWVPASGLGGPGGNPGVVPVIPRTEPGVIPPTNFDTRDAGLKVQANVTTNRETGEITLAIDATLTRFAGFTEYRGLMSPIGARGYTVQPTFKRLWVNTALRVRNDRSMLLGTQAEDDGQRVVIQTIKATILPKDP